MPSGLIDQDHGVGAWGDVEGDLLAMHAYWLAVAAGHHDAGRLALGGTDRAKDPC
jgi:hypothetical protein